MTTLEQRLAPSAAQRLPRRERAVLTASEPISAATPAIQVSTGAGSRLASSSKCLIGVGELAVNVEYLRHLRCRGRGARKLAVDGLQNRLQAPRAASSGFSLVARSATLRLLSALQGLREVGRMGRERLRHSQGRNAIAPCGISPAEAISALPCGRRSVAATIARA